MALRPAPKKKTVDYQKLDELQKEIFGTEAAETERAEPAEPLKKENPQADDESADKPVKTPRLKGKSKDDSMEVAEARKLNDSNSLVGDEMLERAVSTSPEASSSENFKDLETIAERIVLSKAGQGRNTTRPFSLPRTLVIDTTRLKAKFRTIDEQFTQNVIIDFLLREALAAVTPENYKDLRAAAYEFVKRPDETTRRSLTVTEEVVYQMSELKAGINLETGRRYTNDEIFSTLLAIGVSWLYRNGVLV